MYVWSCCHGKSADNYKKYVESEQVYYDSPEKVKYQYELGTKCRAVRFEDGIIAETPRGEIIGRGPSHIKSEDERDLYYAGYEIRIGAEDWLVNIPETHIQIEPRAEFTPKNSKLIPGIGRIPFPAYRGEDPYIFISYAHSDADRVFAEISRFNNQGYHIWYDEGIAPGNEWEDEIAKRLEGCRLFVVFITQASKDHLWIRTCSTVQRRKAESLGTLFGRRQRLRLALYTAAPRLAE